MLTFLDLFLKPARTICGSLVNVDCIYSLSRKVLSFRKLFPENEAPNKWGLGQEIALFLQAVEYNFAHEEIKNFYERIVQFTSWFVFRSMDLGGLMSNEKGKLKECPRPQTRGCDYNLQVRIWAQCTSGSMMSFIPINCTINKIFCPLSPTKWLYGAISNLPQCSSSLKLLNVPNCLNKNRDEFYDQFVFELQFSVSSENT